jgi:hypothetical protein
MDYTPFSAVLVYDFSFSQLCILSAILSASRGWCCQQCGRASDCGGFCCASYCSECRADWRFGVCEARSQCRSQRRSPQRASLLRHREPLPQVPSTVAVIAATVQACLLLSARFYKCQAGGCVPYCTSLRQGCNDVNGHRVKHGQTDSADSQGTQEPRKQGHRQLQQDAPEAKDDSTSTTSAQLDTAWSEKGTMTYYSHCHSQEESWSTCGHHGQ